MVDVGGVLSPEERYRLVGELIKEVKLRRYSFQTGRAYISVVSRFLKSGKTSRDFLLLYSGKSKSSMRSAYFALKFFHEKVLKTGFSEEMPLARRGEKLPVVLNRSEVYGMINATENMKHRLALMLLYYAGLRLDEARSLKWDDVDLERGVIHVK